MNVIGASTANAGDVVQWAVTSGTNDDWQPIDLGNGYYRIVNRNSGKVLNVAGASTADGANVDTRADFFPTHFGMLMPRITRVYLQLAVAEWSGETERAAPSPRETCRPNGLFLRARICTAAGHSVDALADYEVAASMTYRGQGGDGLLAW